MLQTVDVDLKYIVTDHQSMTISIIIMPLVVYQGSVPDVTQPG